MGRLSAKSLNRLEKILVPDFLNAGSAGEGFRFPIAIVVPWEPTY